MKKMISKLHIIILMFLVTMSVSYADDVSPSDNIFVKILNNIVGLVSGPIATLVGVACIAGAGLYVAISGDLTKGGKKAAGIAFGVGIAITASNLVKYFGLGDVTQG